MRWPSAACRTCPGSNGSIMPCWVAMRRIHRSLLMLIDRLARKGARFYAPACARRRLRSTLREGAQPGLEQRQLRAHRAADVNLRIGVAVGLAGLLLALLDHRPRRGVRGLERRRAAQLSNCARITST